MPQPMAARMTRKHTTAMIMPARLPPTTASESAPAVRVFGPRDSESRPTAKIAGRPAPASRPKTTIFHKALRLIKDIVCFPCRSGRRYWLGFGRSDDSGPLVVHVGVVHLGGAGPGVDHRRHRDKDEEIDDHARAAADGGGESVRGGPDDPGGREGEGPGGNRPSGYVPADLGALLAEPGADDRPGGDVGSRQRVAEAGGQQDDRGRRGLGRHALRRLD